MTSKIIFRIQQRLNKMTSGAAFRPYKRNEI